MLANSSLHLAEGEIFTNILNNFEQKRWGNSKFFKNSGQQPL